MEHQAVGNHREVLAGPLHVGHADGNLVRLVGDLALDEAVRLLVLEEQHGVGIADGGPQHALDVVRRRRHDHLQAGHVPVEGLDRLRVVEGSVHAASVRSPHHDGHVPVTVGPVANARRLADQLVEGGVDEVGELDLGNRQHAVHGHAKRDADDCRLGERRVDHAPLPELLQEVGGGAEDAAARSDVLAHHHDPLVGLHLVPERVVDRLDDVLLGHVAAPGAGGSANTCRKALSGSGSGAFHASSTARSISVLTSASMRSTASSFSSSVSFM